MTDPPYEVVGLPVVGDVLVATPEAVTGGVPPGWSFDVEHRYWWHVVLPGEMWPPFECLVFRPTMGMT